MAVLATIDPLTGGLISGLFLIIATMIPLLLRGNRHLSDINDAVNHKGADEPTLRSVAVTSGVGVATLVEVAGRLEVLVNQVNSKVDDHAGLLESHIKQDSDVQHELTTGVTDLKGEIKEIKGMLNGATSLALTPAADLTPAQPQ